MRKRVFKWTGLVDGDREGLNYSLVGWSFGEFSGTFDIAKEIDLRVNNKDYEDFSKTLKITENSEKITRHASKSIKNDIELVIKESCETAKKNCTDESRILRYVVAEFYKRTYGAR